MSFAAQPAQHSNTERYRVVPIAHVARSNQPVHSPAIQDDPLSALQAIGTVAHFARNATIFSDGDDASYSYRIVSGTVRLCKLMPDGRRQIAEFAAPGDFFGFDRRAAYSLTAEALTDVVAIRYARLRLDRLGAERSEIQRSLMDVLSRDLWSAQNHLVMLGRQTAKERVVSFLLALAERSDARDGAVLNVPMTRQDIADYLGLTIETVCRAISELKRARLISIPSRTQIVVRDLERLREIAEADEH
jgi:CRP-like cAMP-binding protein